VLRRHRDRWSRCLQIRRLDGDQQAPGGCPPPEKESSQAAGPDDSLATAAVVSARDSLAGEQSWERPTIASGRRNRRPSLLQPWRTSSQVLYRSNSGCPTPTSRRSTCASPRLCSRPPARGPMAECVALRRSVSGRRMSAFTIATTRRGRLRLPPSSISPAGVRRHRRSLAAAGCVREQALPRSLVLRLARQHRF